MTFIEPTRDSRMFLIALGAASMAVFMAWQVGNQNGFNTGYSVARHLIENSYLGGIIRTSNDIRTLSGFVVDIGVDRITVRTTPSNPFDNPSLTDRIVLVDSSTTITKFIPKDIDIFKSEMDVFTKVTQSKSTPTEDTPPIAPPTPFTFTTADLVDIKVGNALIVTAPNNIKSVKEFTADKIQIQLLTPPTTS